MSHSGSTFCATLADEWVRVGVRHAVIAPGSRSTPLAVALAARPELQLHVVHDERVAAFVALGIGMSTGMPAVVLCTSGTAAAHFHAAVIEAHQSHVPMIVCTADRPPELRETGAAQTVTQTNLFGGAVRWFHDPGVPEHSVAASWRGLAARAATDAVVGAGPVHLNLPFREPLLGDTGPLPTPRSGPWSATMLGEMAPTAEQVGALVRAIDRQRAVVIAGRCAGGYDAAQLHRLAAEAQWPVIADPRSGARTPAPTTISAADALLRSAAFASSMAPDVVIRIGEPPASKVLAEWIATSGAMQVHIGGVDSWADPDRHLSIRAIGTVDRLVASLAGQLRGSVGTPWLASWRRAEHAAQRAVGDVLDAGWSEPAAARAIAAAVPPGGHLVVASSMPVRDNEWYMAPRDGINVWSNRGANGIDGVLSSAIGVAVGTGAPVFAHLGDLAFLHDSSALVALRRRGVRLRIVVSDNDGGAIFSFLPQAAQLPTARFEQLFGTPHGTDLAALAAAHGLDVCATADRASFDAALARPVEGLDVVVATFDRQAVVADHAAVHAAVRDSMDG